MFSCTRCMYCGEVPCLVVHLRLYKSVRENEIDSEIIDNAIFPRIPANWFLATCIIREHNVCAFETCDCVGPSSVFAFSFFLHTYITTLFLRQYAKNNQISYSLIPVYKTGYSPTFLVIWSAFFILPGILPFLLLLSPVTLSNANSTKCESNIILLTDDFPTKNVKVISCY
jgi:hypothetical protein